MRKRLLVIIFCGILALMFSGCGDSKDEDGGLKVGELNKVRYSEEELTEMLHASGALSEKADAVYYDTLDTMLQALNAGKIQMIIADEPSCNYIAAQNKDQYEVKTNDKFGRLEYSLCFPESKQALCDRFSQAIRAMKKDGSLAKLQKSQIEDVMEGKITKETKMPVFDDADDVLIALTGDIPPMDYIDASGTPKGFNVAFLAELAKHAHVNIKLNHISSGAKASALTSGKADAIFWVSRGLEESDPAADADIPERSVQSEAYFETRFAHLTKK